MLIYQVLPRHFGNDNDACVPRATLDVNGCGKFSAFSAQALAQIKSLGTTHIWYTGVLQHSTHTDYTAHGIPLSPADEVKGEAGSPYAVSDYYNVDPDLAESVPDRLHEFDLLVRRTHRAGMDVIIDFIPNHVARTYVGTTDAFTDSNYYPDHIHDGDWTDTAKLCYDSRDTWERMLRILLFWASHHVDGFRCDMAELVPVEFWEWALPQVRARYPHMLFIAEVYQPWRYHDYIRRGTFDYLYDKVGLYDTLIAILRGQESATAITRCWQNLCDLGPHMLHFLENHDERRLASSFICGEGQRALPALIVSTLMDSCPFMIYAGQELGEDGMQAEGFSGIDGKTSIFDYCNVPAILRFRKAMGLTKMKNRKADPKRMLSKTENDLLAIYRHLMQIRTSEPAFQKGKFFDLMYVNPLSADFDSNRQYAFLRKQDDTLFLVVANFSSMPSSVQIVIPSHAFDYLEMPEHPSILGTDLLTGVTCALSLTRDARIPLYIRAHSGVIVRIPL